MELASTPVLGIALAVGSAAVLAVGNLMQSQGINQLDKSVTDAGPKKSGFFAAVRRVLSSRIWVFGSILLLVSTVLQLGALTFAPIMVVQPVGVTALVFTALFTTMMTKKKPTRAVARAIMTCVIGVAGFVTVSALVSTQRAISDHQLVEILVVLLSVLAVAALMLVLGRSRRPPAITWVLLGAVFSAFVATLGKTVIMRVQTALQHHDYTLDEGNLLTIGCLIGIGVAGLLSIYFVQRAHTDNRPDVVIAGLTVVDPGIAVILGILILHEAASAPLWSFFALAGTGAIAVYGVISLARAESSPPQHTAGGSQPRVRGGGPETSSRS